MVSIGEKIITNTVVLIGSVRVSAFQSYQIHVTQFSLGPTVCRNNQIQNLCKCKNNTIVTAKNSMFLAQTACYYHEVGPQRGDLWVSIEPIFIHMFWGERSRDPFENVSFSLAKI